MPIAYNDVDYCLRVKEKGCKVLCTPHAKLFHFESASRKADANVAYGVLKSIKCLKFKRLERYRRFLAEQEYLRKKWTKEIASDPFYKKEYI